MKGQKQQALSLQMETIGPRLSQIRNLSYLTTNVQHAYYVRSKHVYQSFNMLTMVDVTA